MVDAQPKLSLADEYKQPLILQVVSATVLNPLVQEIYIIQAYTCAELTISRPTTS